MAGSARSLAEVCEKPQYGWTTRAAASGTLRLLRTTDISGGAIDWERVPYCAEVPDDPERFLLQDGDVVISRSGSVGVGSVVRNPPRAVFASYLVRFRPTKLVEPAFLGHFLRTPQYRDQVTRLASGIAMPNVNAKKMQTIVLPVPSMETQRRLIGELDLLSTRIDAGDESMNHASRLAEQYEESIYDAATTGLLIGLDADLVGPDSATLPPALPHGWSWIPFGELLREPLRNGHSARASDNGQGIRTLTLTAVTRADFSESNTKVTTADPMRVRDLWLKQDDILIERSNTAELVGTAAVYRGQEQFAIFPDLLIRARLRPDVLVDYVELALKAPRTRRYFRDRASGIAGNMPKIDQGTIAELPIPLPPSDQQRQIVDEAARHLTTVRHMTAAIERNRTRSRALRSAAYADAFSRLESVDREPAA